MLEAFHYEVPLIDQRTLLPTTVNYFGCFCFFGRTHWRLSLKIICPASGQLQELNLLQKSKVLNATNSALLTCNPGEATSYLTIDIVVEEDRAKQFPVTLQLLGVPPHKLDLKVGVPLNASADF